MNEKTVGTSQGFWLRRAFGAAPAAYLAMACALACSGGAGNGPDDDSSYDDEQMDSIGDNNAVHDGTEEKALLKNAVVARQCETCTTKPVCEQKLVPCDPPVVVNGREIKCLEEICRDELVCTPCGAGGELDGTGGIDPGILGGLGGISPIDPLPFVF
jgi:hypothetical protein